MGSNKKLTLPTKLEDALKLHDATLKSIATKIAQAHSNTDYEVADLYQEAIIAFIELFPKVDRMRDIKQQLKWLFTSISGTVRNRLKERGYMIPIPRSMIDQKRGTNPQILSLDNELVPEGPTHTSIDLSSYLDAIAAVLEKAKLTEAEYVAIIRYYLLRQNMRGDAIHLAKAQIKLKHTVETYAHKKN